MSARSPPPRKVSLCVRPRMRKVRPPFLLSQVRLSFWFIVRVWLLIGGAGWVLGGGRLVVGVGFVVGWLVVAGQRAGVGWWWVGGLVLGGAGSVLSSGDSPPPPVICTRKHY